MSVSIPQEELEPPNGDESSQNPNPNRYTSRANFVPAIKARILAPTQTGIGQIISSIFQTPAPIPM